MLKGYWFCVRPEPAKWWMSVGYQMHRWCHETISITPISTVLSQMSHEISSTLSAAMGNNTAFSFSIPFKLLWKLKVHLNTVRLHCLALNTTLSLSIAQTFVQACLTRLLVLQLRDSLEEMGETRSQYKECSDQICAELGIVVLIWTFGIFSHVT
jgi:hypothetical protein